MRLSSYRGLPAPSLPLTLTGLAVHRYLVEFLGTTVLSFTYGTAVLYGPTGGGVMPGAMAVGAVYMAMIYAGGHVSGAHYNPAVSLGFLVRGRGGTAQFAGYLVGQLTGAFVGGVAAAAASNAVAPAAAALHSGPILLGECLFTFALVFVVLHTATARANAGNSFYGLAAGAVVVAGMIAVGTLTLGSFNPALSLMLSLSGRLAWSDLGFHFLAQGAAAVAAAFTFRAVCPEDH